jgi:hypothetical protein
MAVLMPLGWVWARRTTTSTEHPTIAQRAPQSDVREFEVKLSLCLCLCIIHMFVVYIWFDYVCLLCLVVWIV